MIMPSTVQNYTPSWFIPEQGSDPYESLTFSFDFLLCPGGGHDTKWVVTEELEGVATGYPASWSDSQLLLTLDQVIVVVIFGRMK